MTTTTNILSTTNQESLDPLAKLLLHHVATSTVPGELKPFAILLAAGTVCHVACEASPQMRAHVVKALVNLLRHLAPEIVIDLPAQDVAH